jgi:hypothetical protein
MANIKVSELTELTSPTASSADKFLLITDSSSGIPVSKKISLSTLDTFLDVTNSHANGAFNKANGAYDHANAAFVASNTFASSSGTANAAFIQANAGILHAQSAFIQANAVFTQSNNYVWPTGNAAFIQANAVFAQSNIYVWPTANAAFVKANLGLTHAQSAFITANASFSAVNTIIDFAASAFNQGNTTANLTISFSATTILEVLNNSSSAYIFTQYGALNNPNISTFSATTLGFKLNVTGHPFHIRTGDNTADYNTGLVHVSSNGTLSYDSAAQGKVDGTLFWRIPYNVVGNYKYRCANHPGAMIGSINVANTAGIYFAYNS